MSQDGYYLEQMELHSWVEREELSHLRDLNALAEKVSHCQDCSLHQNRSRTVFSRGNPRAPLMIIGEAPGFNEDKQGLPFVGKAGALLDRMLASIGLNQNDVYIANVLKCRPPENRYPSQEEISRCSPYLVQQINLIKPKLLLGLGKCAAEFLLKTAVVMHKIRGSWQHYAETPCLISYHPAYLLRNPSCKKQAYQDLLQVQKKLNARDS